MQLVQSYRDILTNDYSSFEEQFGEQLNSDAAADVFIDDVSTKSDLSLFEYSLSLSEDKKSLLMTSKVTDEVKKLSKQLLLKKAQLEIVKTEVESSGSDIKDTTLKNAIVADLTTQINSLTTLITQAQNVENQAGSSYNFNYSADLRKQIADILNPNASEAEKELSTQITQKLDSLAAGAGVSNDRRAIFLDSTNLQGVASALNSASNKTTANQIFDSILTSSASLNEAVSIALSKDNFAKTLDDLNSNASSQANANSASSSVSSTMNLSNDVAIGSRLASLNNPFANLAYAKKLSKAYFASGSSDVRFNYGLNDLTQSRWANIFGGVNIIDSKSGGVYGLSLGVDKKIKDNAILGFYASFAKATLKDKSLEQKSSNFQVGTYSSIAFNNDLELGLKAYLGVSPTEQESFYSLAGISNSTSEYARLSAGINANLGKNFALSEDTLFIKPFVGTNYYLTHTPEYTEQGGLAKNVKSANNNSISVELGAEFRKYFNEFAYFYTTPKIEQFVYNQSDDFSASFIGSNTGFNIQSDDKLKTYAQLILGASMNFTDNFAATASFAGKQIVAGKVDKKNETYMSGNLELRYRF